MTIYVASEYIWEDKPDLFPSYYSTNSGIKIKCWSACLGLFRDNAVSITIQLCKPYQTNQTSKQRKNRRSQMNPGKRDEVQASRTIHAEIPEER